MALQKNNFEIINLLLSNNKIDVNIPYKEKLFIQIKYLNFYKTKKRITNLYCAVKERNIEVIKLLLNRSDINVNEKSICDYF